ARATVSKSISRRTCFFRRTPTTLSLRPFEEPICAESSLPVHCSPLCSSSVARSRLPVTLPMQRRCAKHSSSVFVRIHRLRSAGWESRMLTNSRKTRNTDYQQGGLSQMKRTSLTLAAMLSIMSVTIAHAQFGSGIVYDPTQSAHAITQIEHEERSISNQVQQIENGQQIFSN